MRLYGLTPSTVSSLAERKRKRQVNAEEDHESEIPLDYRVYAEDPGAEWQEAWSLTEDLIRQTRDTARRVGARYAVVIASTPQSVRGPEEGLSQLLSAYPAMNQESWDLTLPTARLVEFCEAEGIPVLDLTPGLHSRSKDGTVLHFPYDGHWNPAGHQAAADLLTPFILTQAPSGD